MKMIEAPMISSADMAGLALEAMFWASVIQSTERFMPVPIKQVEEHDLDASGDAEPDVPLNVWSGPPRSAEADEDEARRDDDVALHHRDDKLNGDGDEGQRGDDAGEDHRERGAEVGEEGCGAGCGHKRTGDVDASA